MSVVDPSSGLYNEAFFHATFANRLAAAKRQLRPLTLVLVRVARGVRADDPGPEVDVDAVVVADAVRRTLRDADIACSLECGLVAILLEETPELGAIGTVERLRQTIAASDPRTVVWSGVAGYPAHAFEVGPLLAAARAALAAATQWRQDRVEVAPVSAD